MAQCLPSSAENMPLEMPCHAAALAGLGKDKSQEVGQQATAFGSITGD